MITQEQIDIIKNELSNYEVSKLGVFGSFARNEETLDSDIDLLVSFNSQVSLFDIIEIELRLSELLGIKVDLITERSLSQHLKPYIEADLKLI